MSDNPKRAIGTKQYRVNRAIHLHFTTDKSYAEIADELGVSERTARTYVHSPPGDEVRETLADQATQVRMAAFAELKRQLRAAGSRSRSAEKPVKIYENDDGEIEVWDEETDAGERYIKGPKVQDIDLLPDEQARFYARKEARDVLEQLIDLVGAGEPEQLELSGSVEHEADEDLSELMDKADDLF